MHLSKKLEFFYLQAEFQKFLKFHQNEKIVEKILSKNLLLNIKIDQDYVSNHIEDLANNADLSKFIL